MPSGDFHRVREEIIARAKRVADEVAAKHADDVDQNARFPIEALEALRKERLLGCAVPVELGGEGSGLAELAQICCTLAQACATTGMVFAMHRDSGALHPAAHRSRRAEPFWSQYLTDCAERQRLIASATSEPRGSAATSAPASARWSAEPRASRSTSRLRSSPTAPRPTTSWSRHVAIREAAPSDQVLVLVKKGEFTLDAGRRLDTPSACAAPAASVRC